MAKVMLDTHPIVDYVEEAGAFSDVYKILSMAKQGKIRVSISIITLTELGYVITDEDAKDYATGYFLAANIEKLIATAEIGVFAGELKRRYRISLADSLIVATAILNDCNYVISNDPDMKKITEIKVLSPKEFLKGAH